MADYTVIQIIEAKAKEYVSPDVDSRIPIFEDLADQQLTQCLKDNNRTYAIALQVLHWLALSDRTNEGADGGETGSGAITERKEGELRVKYGSIGGSSSSAMKEELQQTPYGTELYAFLKKFSVYAYTRRIGNCGTFQ